MRTTRAAILCLFACACQSPRDALEPRVTQPKITLLLGFDLSKPDAAPAGFSATGGAWKVVVDDSAPSPKQALAHTTRAEGKLVAAVCDLALLDDVKAAEVEISVKLKAVGGTENQGGGLIWRAQDARNYYYARWDPIEKTLRAYEVQDGERKQLATADARLEAGWHELRVTTKGEHTRVVLDGRATLSFRDSSFVEAGKVGLWTAPDAETRFDELSIRVVK